MRRISIVAVVAASVLIAAPNALAARHSSRRCAPGHAEKVLRQTGVAVLLVHRVPEYEAEDLVGCSRATGQRRVITTSVHDFDAYDMSSVVAFRGSALVLWSSSWDKQGSYDALIADDALHEGRRRLLAGGETLAVPAVTVRSDGTAAWTQAVRVAEGSEAAGEVLSVSTPDGASRVLDSGADLGGPAITSSEVRWKHGAAARRGAVRPADACGPQYASGSQQVGIQLTKESLSACDRSTGRVVTTAGSVWDRPETPGHAAFGGRYVAALVSGQIAVLDTLAGTATSVPAPGVADVVVSEDGWLAWLRFARPDDLNATYDVIVRDALGERLVGSAPSNARLVRDGRSVRWSAKRGPARSVWLQG